jgi:hypothetical protein
MATAKKTSLIKARITTKTKRRLAEIARQRGESEAVIVREAIAQYVERVKRSTLLLFLSCGLAATFAFAACRSAEDCACSHCQCGNSLIVRREAVGPFAAA